MGTSTARIASKARLITRGARWLDSNTSPHTKMNAHSCSRANSPSRPITSMRAWVYRGCASASKKWRVMPSCQSAVCKNLTPHPVLDEVRYQGERICLVGHRRPAAPTPGENSSDHWDQSPWDLSRNQYQKPPLALAISIHFYNGGEDDHPNKCCSNACCAGQSQSGTQHEKHCVERGKSTRPQGAGCPARVQPLRPETN